MTAMHFGIFRILPGEKDTELFDTYVETKHNLTAKHLSEMYGFGYSSVKEKKDLKMKITEFFNSSQGPALLEIFTPSMVNDKILTEYFNFIS